jgi:hypothetical protein
VVTAAIAFAYLAGVGFVAAGVYLSVRRRGFHPLLLVCIAALSISWLEAPYDWAVYAQFDPDIPRMPSWWPLNMTWGGLPASVPIGYIAYFVLPAVIAVALARRWQKSYLLVGFIVGFSWALFFNGYIGARLGVFYYGRVIPGLALFGGTKHQYPVYDAVAMALQMMVFTYLLARVDQWRWSALRAVAVFVLVAHALYGSLFGLHLGAKAAGWVTDGPSQQLFEGVPNQPLHGGY